MQPTVMLVLGMHRSGTSALARMINLLGADLGRHLLPATPSNPGGHWENGPIVAAHEALFVAMGKRWDSLEQLPSAWLDSDAGERLLQQLDDVLGEEFADGPLLAVKDPRMSHLVPAWQRLAASRGRRLVAVVMVRHPEEVARSLMRRDGMSRPHAEALTLLHMLEAERASRGLPRVFVHYDELLADWRRQAERIAAALDMVWPTGSDAAAVEIAGFLNPGFRHHRAAAPSDADDSPLAQIHAAFSAACRDAIDDRELAERVDAWFALWPVFERVLAESAALQPLHRLAASLEQDRAQIRQVLDFQMARQRSGLFKVYYRSAAAAYDESRCVVREVRLDEPVDVELEFEPVGELDYLRIDFAEQPGTFIVRRVDVDGAALAPLGGHLSHVAGDALPRLGSELLRFASPTADPYIELDLRGRPPGGNAIRVRVEFELESLGTQIRQEVNSALPALVERRFDQGWRQQVQALREVGQEFGREVADRLSASLLVEIDARVKELLVESNARTEHLLDARQREQGAVLQRELHALQARLEAEAHRQRVEAALTTRLRRAAVALLGSVPLVAERLRAEPAHELERQTDGAWRATGADPHFHLLGWNSPTPWAAGWYAFDCIAQGRGDATLQTPCLYVDQGGGFTEAGRYALQTFARSDRLECIFFAPGPIRALRLDPTTRPGVFYLERPRLRRLGRLRAAAGLARQAACRPVPAGERRSMLGVLAEVARRARREGVERAGGWLYQQVHEASAPSHGFAYAEWVDAFDTLDAAACAALAERVRRLQRRPRFSVVMPVYNTPDQWLRRAIDSVLAQVYPDWELCIADDASPNPSVKRTLREYMQRDPRVRCVFRESNGHISAASNSALEIAQGDYVVLLDHDDELPPHALAEVALRLEREPGLRMIYSDEDKIDERGRRFDPYFKPDWNPDLFLSQNCVSHLGVYETGLVREVGGFREGFEGSQDYDLALRCIERLRADEIGHIPRVLYHWRAIAGSTALRQGEKNYASEAGLRAIADHLQRTGSGAQVSAHPRAPGLYRVRWPLPEPLPRVSLLVPTRDRVDLLRVCVDSVRQRSTYPDIEIVIVDNGSVEAETHAFFESFARQPNSRVLKFDGPFNFSAINNAAARAASGSVLCLLNNDIEIITPDWLEEMVGHALRQDIGAVGAMLYYPDDTIQHAGVIIGFGGVAGHSYARKPRGYPGQMGRALLTQNLSAVTAACLVVRREVFDAVGGLDESLAVAFNDIDFCLRIEQAGYRNVWTPFAEFYHHESASRGSEDSPEKLARFHSEVRKMEQRWGERLRRDPAYNPNLDLNREPFALAFPPAR